MGGMNFGSRMMDPGAWDAWAVLVWVLAAVVIAAVAVLVVGVLRGGRSTVPSAPGGPSPAAILEERFARGEISEEEFERRRRVLAGR